MEYCNGFYRDEEVTLCVLKKLLEEDVYEQIEDKRVEYLEDEEIDLQKLKDKYLPLTTDNFIIRIYSRGIVDDHVVVLPKYDILLTKNAKYTEMKEIKLKSKLRKKSRSLKKKSLKKSLKKKSQKSLKEKSQKKVSKSQKKSRSLKKSLEVSKKSLEVSKKSLKKKSQKSLNLKLK